ncbi:hypothetical protein CCP3SC15_380004 [Gammaproteobacteria bacterium]
MINEKWTALQAPPPAALKEIKGGRMSGKTDINPQWRIKAMTEVYGQCGIGWKWDIVKEWTVQAGDEVLAFVRVNVWTRDGDKWSEPIPGVGGNKLIEKESKGLRNNDECFKMATTDALSVAFKFLGVASLIYEGQFDHGKYNNEAPPAPASNGKGLSRKEVFFEMQKKAFAVGAKKKFNEVVDAFLADSKTLDELSENDFDALIKFIIANKKGVKNA